MMKIRELIKHLSSAEDILRFWTDLQEKYDEHMENNK